MLGQKKEFSTEISTGEIIEYNESLIDINLPTYLITWSPDPKEMPDSDLYVQNQVNIDTLSSFLKYCKCGIFCLESTQLGNIHYHGWYQVDDYLTPMRVAIVKAMQRFGNVRITKARKVKINSYVEKGNALYYYKKELYSMISIQPNPITRDSERTLDPNAESIISFLDMRKTSYSLSQIVTDRQYYMDFYKDTIKKIL